MRFFSTCSLLLPFNLKQIAFLALRQPLKKIVCDLDLKLYRLFASALAITSYRFSSICVIDVIHHDKHNTVKVKCVFNQARLSAIQLPWYFKDLGVNSRALFQKMKVIRRYEHERAMHVTFCV